VIAAIMGWSIGYTRGVLFGWKMTAAYCRAVLSHDQRIALDGALAEPVDAKAKDLATKRLAHEAEACSPTRGASAIARPGACRTPAPGRIGGSHAGRTGEATGACLPYASAPWGHVHQRIRILGIGFGIQSP
jgi:hypothetical protein